MTAVTKDTQLMPMMLVSGACQREVGQSTAADAHDARGAFVRRTGSATADVHDALLTLDDRSDEGHAADANGCSSRVLPEGSGPKQPRLMLMMLAGLSCVEQEWRQLMFMMLCLP